MQFYDLRGLKSEKDQPAQRGRKEELILFKVQVLRQIKQN